jgi:hypothetical protein
MFVDDVSASLPKSLVAPLAEKVVEEFGALGYSLNEAKTSVVDGCTLLNEASETPLVVQVHGRDLEVIGHQGQDPSKRGSKLLGAFFGCTDYVASEANKAVEALVAEAGTLRRKIASHQLVSHLMRLCWVPKAEALLASIAGRLEVKPYAQRLEAAWGDICAGTMGTTWAALPQDVQQLARRPLRAGGMGIGLDYNTCAHILGTHGAVLQAASPGSAAEKAASEPSQFTRDLLMAAAARVHETAEIANDPQYPAADLAVQGD